MNLLDNFLFWLIVACEIGFWAFLFAGLAARYLLRNQQLSRVLLLCVPLVDLVLLVTTVIDLRGGATANFAHGLAAAYIGFTVAFGHAAIRWADARFAHRFADGPEPARPPKHGWSNLKYELALWGRCLLAVVITWILLFAAIALVGEPERTKELVTWYGRMTVVAFFWFIFGPLWSLLFDSWRGKEQESD